jgi:hypothetical protein
VQPYSSIYGDNVPFGVVGYKRTKQYVSTDDLYQVGASRDRERELGLIQKGKFFLKNVGAALHKSDEIAPATSGFQEAKGTSQIVVGKALQDVGAGKYGFVQIDIKDARKWHA